MKTNSGKSQEEVLSDLLLQLRKPPTTINQIELLQNEDIIEVLTAGVQFCYGFDIGPLQQLRDPAKFGKLDFTFKSLVDDPTLDQLQSARNQVVEFKQRGKTFRHYVVASLPLQEFNGFHPKGYRRVILITPKQCPGGER